MKGKHWIILGVTSGGVLLLLGCLLVALGLIVWSRTPAAGAFATPGSANSLLTPSSAGGSPQVGQPAPDFTVNDFEGKPVQLADLRGKSLVLNFWATWCGPCSAEMPNLEQVYQKLNPAEVTILAVNQGEHVDQVKGYRDLYRLHFPIVFDEKLSVANAYNVRALPTTYFIDREGVIREIHLGGPMSVEYIQAQVNKLLGK